MNKNIQQPIERFVFEGENGQSAYEVPNKAGDWVRYEDHVKAIGNTKYSLNICSNALSQQPSVEDERKSIKTWQERCNWTSNEPATKLMVQAMKAEIADLRAALSPAAGQPTITAETLLRSVYQRGDLTKEGRESFIKELMEGKAELTIDWGDFQLIAAMVPSAAGQQEIETLRTQRDELAKQVGELTYSDSGMRILRLMMERDELQKKLGGKQATPEGWKWMTHPSRNNGNPIPVRFYAEEGTDWYQPFNETWCDFLVKEMSPDWKEVHLSAAPKQAIQETKCQNG